VVCNCSKIAKHQNIEKYTWVVELIGMPAANKLLTTST